MGSPRSRGRLRKQVWARAPEVLVARRLASTPPAAGREPPGPGLGSQRPREPVAVWASPRTGPRGSGGANLYPCRKGPERCSPRARVAGYCPRIGNCGVPASHSSFLSDFLYSWRTAASGHYVEVHDFPARRGRCAAQSRPERRSPALRPVRARNHRTGTPVALAGCWLALSCSCARRGSTDPSGVGAGV